MRAMILRWFSMVALVAAGCGGSGSETPWPVEPAGPVLGPSGESSRPQNVTVEPGARDKSAADEDTSEPDAGAAKSERDAGMRR